MEWISNFVKDERDYFRTCKKEIIVKNNNMLVKAIIIYSFIMLFYTIFSFITQDNDTLHLMYIIFDGIHITLTVIYFILHKKYINSYHFIQWFCACFEVSVLSFFAIEGAITSSSDPALYIPNAIILVLLVFVHHMNYSIIITLVYLAVFITLSYMFKTTYAFINDTYICLATLFSSWIGFYLISSMRHKEGQALLNYEILSQTDQLTGLYNKTSIQDIYNHLLSENNQCPFIIVDLDDFKRVNDIYGHNIGDEVLKSVSKEIELNFRSSDYLGRFGGDEFIVIMNNCHNENIVIKKVENLMNCISCLEFSNKELHIKCSVGLTFPYKNDTSVSVFKRADEALYQAKKTGKGKYYIKY